VDARRASSAAAISPAVSAASIGYARFLPRPITGVLAELSVFEEDSANIRQDLAVSPMALFRPTVRFHAISAFGANTYGTRDAMFGEGLLPRRVARAGEETGTRTVLRSGVARAQRAGSAPGWLVSRGRSAGRTACSKPSAFTVRLTRSSLLQGRRLWVLRRIRSIFFGLNGALARAVPFVGRSTGHVDSRVSVPELNRFASRFPFKSTSKRIELGTRSARRDRLYK
jgi:hypothetical protein